MTSPRNVRAKTAGPAWWRILVEVATVVAVPSVLLYVLGLVVFWLRIANEYNRVNIGTTWYAASLVPRSTAAASGAEAIARGFKYGALASSVILLAVYVFLYAKARRRGGEERFNLLSSPILVLRLEVAPTPAGYEVRGAFCTPETTGAPVPRCNSLG